ncbi:undecaprenyl-phosphate alpha-N-acetylglucosaminyl 1-phosphate transferase [Pseudoalteromonas piscicida]|uniref:Undecaprenyl-phosphate alpha-N-acetylglucosaminyl 1-phosphate transferase n=2 Tax=Pseudoalteromonas piscicida TaxID=43662 RepID=A0AAQ2EVS1_PSEO7|nr:MULTISPECIES: UDP-N-acetylglucosamine--undecaprenyl-phosphate N-acetylglucosaminephosphotransferase [Pseudoalteromonas]KJY90431.1 UDP-phosphate N-acetylglucosaminyl 1-phosphate transferase [Pseudoalteromonas piscicida]TMN43975.1 undecaprenyl-phosphate alpha-N-acetylglucosaminyl 1-phosphate transferase [Pseudoalteromonas piscicida]TMN44124.1 undecaprenyl-phosphate alpha-N-acetylglucosaminyl 1-phosphate transferase [Pseudoalteromonas piscicida]TMN49740.1 undecaprenyl-phosphate alpha-N-acetylgl
MWIFMVIFFAFLASYCSIFMIKPVAERFGLVDVPCSRKKHVGAIPLIGGVSIFVAVLASIIVFLPLEKKLIVYLICAAAIVLLGVIDDYRQLGVKIRLGVQALVALIMMWGSDAYIHNLGNLFGFGSIDLGLLGIPFTVIAVIAAINAFNMIDGIDGLAGAMSITTFAAILILMGVNGGQLSVLPLIIIATIVPYLAFNLGVLGHRNKKIFMGDAGSMFIGLSVIWLLMIATQSEVDNAFSPVTALWIIAIPLMDMMAIIIRRVKKGHSPFKADRDHLHHVFMRIGFSSRKALITISTLAVFLASIGIVGELIGIPHWFMLVLFIGIFVAYSACIQHAWKVARFLRKHVFIKKIKE